MNYYSIPPRSDELWHYGIKGMKWGVKNGPPYPLNKNKLSSDIFRAAKTREPVITKDITEVFDKNLVTPYGLEHRLKSRRSIERKIHKDAVEKGVSEAEASKGIRDAVRYTGILSDENYTHTYNQIKRDLANRGYREIRCRNYFDQYRKGKVKHKSVQSIFETRDGYPFEIQFHTKGSQKAKNDKLPLYEEARKIETTADRKRELERMMVELAEKVKDPKDVYSIKSYG